MKIKIGVMGSAQGPTIENQENIKKAIQIGHTIAKNNCILVNGACPGLPDDAAFGARQAGGFVMGISPAFSHQEHVVKYKSPDQNYDVIVYSGLGLMERDIINIRSADAILLLGGGVGTLNEFTVAYDEGKVVGVLTGSGGVSNHIPEILKICARNQNSNIIFDSDPKKLVERTLEALKQYPSPFMEDAHVLDGKP
ncbi:LOG family protein [Candidatus Peregrinibacteria bacterium]|nr:LOG family protein [Candidatus Peregrinibacteria bacterium]